MDKVWCPLSPCLPVRASLASGRTSSICWESNCHWSQSPSSCVPLWRCDGMIGVDSMQMSMSRQEWGRHCQMSVSQCMSCPLHPHPPDHPPTTTSWQGWLFGKRRVPSLQAGLLMGSTALVCHFWESLPRQPCNAVSNSGLGSSVKLLFQGPTGSW